MEPYAQWRKSTSGGIRYKHLEGPSFDCEDMGGISARERYVIRAEDVTAFYNEVLPPPVIALGVAILPLRRSLPGASQLITRKLSFKPVTDDLPADPLASDSGAASGTYNGFYFVDISYETKKESVVAPDPSNPETFLERSVDVGVELLAINPKKTEVASGQAGATPGTAEANHDQLMPITKSIPLVELSYRWEYVLSPNWARILSMVGSVNSIRRSLFMNAEVDCVMFNGVSGSQTFLWDTASATYGVQPWKLDFSFSIRRINDKGGVYGWNHVWSPHKNEWVFLERDGTLLYPRQDLLTLFLA